MYAIRSYYEAEITIAPTGKDSGSKAIKLDVFNTANYDGAFGPATYLFGGRSFSIWDASDMSLVYDSGSTLETKTNEYLPSYFNYSNDDTVFEKRSAKKGPEPEDVKVATINGETYAYVGLERIGGVMAFNITDPANVYFVV